MKRIPYLQAKKLLLWMVLCMIAFSVMAQKSGTAPNVSQLSNQQILMMWQQAQKGGGNENDAIKQLIRSTRIVIAHCISSSA